jgi:hypothetical protein
MKKISREELCSYAATFNQKRLERGLKSASGREIFLSMLHGYLFLCRANEYPKEQYEAIKNALQDITDWFTIGLDIEQFEMTMPNGAVVTDRVLVELDEND